MSARQDSHRRMPLRVAAALGFAAVFPGFTFAGPPAACTLTFEPAAVVAGTQAQEIKISLSEEIGEGKVIDALQPQAESGLRIAVMDAAQLSLAVDATAAKPGEWNVTAHAGETAVCTGVLRVEATPGA